MQPSVRASTNRKRQNIVLAWALVAFAMAVMVSVFWWRFSHHQSALPAGGATGKGYAHSQGQGYNPGQPQGAPLNNFAY